MLWLIGKNIFNQSVKNDLRASDNIQKMTTVQGDDYTICCLQDYHYFKNYYKIIAIDLSKKQVLDADPKTIQQINFTGNLDRDGNTTMAFDIKDTKETVLDFYREQWEYYIFFVFFCFDIISI